MALWTALNWVWVELVSYQHKIIGNDSLDFQNYHYPTSFLITFVCVLFSLFWLRQLGDSQITIISWFKEINYKNNIVFRLDSFGYDTKFNGFRFYGTKIFRFYANWHVINSYMIYFTCLINRINRLINITKMFYPFQLIY